MTPEEPFTVRMEVKPRAFRLSDGQFFRMLQMELDSIAERILLERERRLS